MGGEGWLGGWWWRIWMLGLDVSGSWYEWRSVRVRAEVALVCDRMAEDAESWREAYRDWKRACVSPGRTRCDELERQVVAATGGLGLSRWQAALRRRRFRTIEDAKLKAKALRARPAVKAALAELDSIVSDRDAEVSAAASRLGRVFRADHLIREPCRHRHGDAYRASCADSPVSLRMGPVRVTGMVRPR